MTGPAGPPQDLGRFTTFLDAVVAIAVTLLVLPLVDLAVDAEPEKPLLDLLRDNLGLLASFVLSFLVIIQLWRAHHRLLEPVERYDGLLLRASVVWVFTIVFLPFPTRLISVYGTDRLELALYIGTLVLSTAALTVTHWHLERTPGLRRAGQVSSRHDLGSSLVMTGLMVAALVVAVALPSVGYAALLLLLLGPLAARLRRRRTRA